MWIRGNYGQEPIWPRVVLMIVLVIGAVWLELSDIEYVHADIVEESDG